MIHNLKTLSPFFEAVDRGDKTFEVRKNDRDFKVNDRIILWHVDPNFSKDGGSIHCFVTYILYGGQYGIDPEYCVMGIKRV